MSKEKRSFSKTKLAAVEIREKLLNQAKQVVAGNQIIADRIVSFFNPNASPIKKGKLARGTDFGYKARFDETEKEVSLPAIWSYEEFPPTTSCSFPP